MDSSVVTLILGISSGAVGVLSVLSQFIIVVINNRHQERISKREMFVRRQIEAVEKYLASVGKALDHDNVTDFRESRGTIFLYTPKETWDDIRRLNSLLSTGARYDEPVAAECYVLLEKISQSLTDYLNSIKR